MTQPVGIGALIVGFVNSVLAMAVLLDWVALDTKQIAGINFVVVNAVLLGTAIWTWYRSTPVAAPTLKAGTQVKVTDASGTRIGTTTVGTDA
jgi:hypothetical protein